MNKKVLIGVSLLTILILLVVGYYFFTKKVTPTNTNSDAPFGNGSDTPILPQNSTVNQQTTPTNVPNTIEIKQGGLRKISSTPVSDGNFLLSSATSSSPKIRFIERSTGHTYEADLDTNINNRITNTTIPKIETVGWGIPGKLFFAQYVDNDSIQDAIIEIGHTSTSTKPTTPTAVDINGFFEVTKYDLPQNIISGSFSPNGSNLFYLIKGSRGVEGYTSTNQGGKPVLIWQYPTTEWISKWVGTNTVSLNTKASNGESGILYFLDTKTKNIQLILSEIPGLTSNTSPLGTRTLYTSIKNKDWKSFIFETKLKTNLFLPFITLPEKCVWTKNELTLYCARPQAVSAHAPDDWYQGLVSFTDSLWKFDFATSELTEISNLKPDDNTSIDLINPHISQNEDYLVFTNKKDMSLWAIPTK